MSSTDVSGWSKQGGRGRKRGGDRGGETKGDGDR